VYKPGNRQEEKSEIRKLSMGMNMELSEESAGDIEFPKSIMDVD
jgi:hypothetical protein